MKFLDTYVKKFISDEKYNDVFLKANKIQNDTLNKTCLGKDMMGWFDLETNIEQLKEHAKKINDSSDVVLVIGIGGSYLGALASIKFLRPSNEKKVFFLGFSLDPEYFENIFEVCNNKNVHVIVISKSGNTIEIKATLQIVLDYMKKKYGLHLKDKFTIVSGYSGFLRSFAKENEWKIFDIPENVGGRYSVLTNVGLLPIIVSGADASEIIEGALYSKKQFENIKSDSYRYAILRNILFELNFNVELFCSFSHRLGAFVEWIKQLFAESEGKNGKGIFPSSSLFSTDLHSIGQFVQEGNKILFETILVCKNNKKDIILKNKNEPILKFDSLNEINNKILNAVSRAHNEGGVPVNIIEFDEYSEFELGNLLFFFETSCWISSNLFGVDPSNQPGVQKYKSILN